MTCEHCRSIKVVPEITSPEQLSQTLRGIREAIASGVLAIDQDASRQKSPFPWTGEVTPPPPNLNQHLYCTFCGQKFRLSAETTSGIQGYFSREDDPG
ncbi:hypothetical protein [Spirulina subsalsa]|uniref:hypothetical protein n=1 Tax=Spirulina subsalsa TaxID=54311 RepID=UPI0002E5F8D8|nr:hypothetical protein [Spirulina subsalsa]